MAAFINLAADPTSWNILEVRAEVDITLEDGLVKTLINVFHYHKSSSTGNPSLAGIAAWFNGNIMATFTPLLNVRCSNPRCFVRPLDDPYVMEVEDGVGAGAPAVTGDPLSVVLAAVITLNTGVRGRSFQGRKHFSGLSESDTDGGDELKAGSITTWTGVGSAIAVQANDGAGNTYNPCVLSPTLSGILNVPPYFTGADVVDTSLNHILGTMRRRKEKVPA